MPQRLRDAHMADHKIKVCMHMFENTKVPLRSSHRQTQLLAAVVYLIYLSTHTPQLSENKMLKSIASHDEV